MESAKLQSVAELVGGAAAAVHRRQIHPVQGPVPDEVGLGDRQGEQGVSLHPGELPPGEVIVRIPGQMAPSIGERIRAIAPRDKLHLFSADGRQRIDI